MVSLGIEPRLQEGLMPPRHRCDWLGVIKIMCTDRYTTRPTVFERAICSFPPWGDVETNLPGVLESDNLDLSETGGIMSMC